ncbi:MAG: flippase [Patescibacteria group bacterium]|jgi:O-antigen/teichoic acid export membrane protein
MTPQPVRIAKNTTYLTVAYIVQKILAFLYFVLIARMVGVADIGKYVFALSFTSIFGILIDLGLSSVLTREGAKDQNKIKDYLGNIIGIKTILASLTYIAVVVAVNLIDKDLLSRQLVYISGLIMILDSFYLSFYAAFRAQQSLKYEAIGMTIGQFIIVSCGATSLLLHLPLHFLVGSILAGSAFNFFYSAVLVFKKFNFLPTPRVNKALLKVIFKIAIPFAIAGIFARVYGYIDSVLLSTLSGDEAVGWYSAGYKITFALQFIPMAMSAALFPAMANYFIVDKTQLARVFEKSMHYLLLISMPITFGVFVLANEFIVKMYGTQFAPTTGALKILIICLVFNFLSFPIGALLNACNKQTQNTINMGITMLINVIFNIILIPFMGAWAYVGAAIAALVGTITLFVLGMFYVGGIIRYNKIFLIKGFFKVLVACVCMTVVIIFLKPMMNFLFLVPIGGVVYLIVLILLKGINWTEAWDLVGSFRK